MDRPYDPNDQYTPEGGEKPFPDTWDEEDIGGAPGPSTMDHMAGMSEQIEVIDQVLPEAHRSPWISRPIDNTALEMFMSCPAKFEMAMLQNRRTRGVTAPLAYGITWHTIMETYYRYGGVGTKEQERRITDAAAASWQDHGDPEEHRTLKRCVNELTNYIKVYGDFEDDTRGFGQTVGYPENPLLEISSEVWWPGAKHPYTVKIDRIYESNGLYYVEDYKTTSSMGVTFFSQFDPDNQMLGYATIAGIITGLPIAGLRINAHAILKASSKFARQVFYYSDDRIAEWKENYNWWIEQIEVSIQRNRFPRNFKACAGKYGPCAFSGLCTFDRPMRQQILENDFDLNPWNPLDPNGEENG